VVLLRVGFLSVLCEGIEYGGVDAGIAELRVNIAIHLFTT
jgi:hypothetical protein